MIYIFTLRTMRAFTILLFILPLHCICFAQSAKEEKFNTTIKQVVLAFSKQDNAAVSKLINKKIGVYQLYREGVYDNIKKWNTLNFSDNSFPAVLLNSSKGILLSALFYSTLPVYNCTKETWSKKGLFTDTTKTDHSLSKSCTILNHDEAHRIPKQKIEFYFALESKSRRIVLQDRKGKELVFNLTWIDENWFLTIIDNASSDCSV